MQTDGRVRGGLVTDASGARALLSAPLVRCALLAPRRAHPDHEIRSPLDMEQTKWSVDALTMKASTHTGESGV